MDDFSAQYYEPVRAFFGVLLGNSSEDPHDHTQAFFASKILSRRLLRAAKPELGSFRHFLKQSLRNYTRDVFRKAQRTTAREVHIEAEEYSVDLAADDVWDEVDAAFHEAWVRSLLQRAMDEVTARCQEKGQGAHLDLFVSRYMDSAESVPSWTELGERYGIDQRKARSRAETVARQLRGIILNILAEDAGSEKAAEVELDALVALLEVTK